jgi:hypothetical protein
MNYSALSREARDTIKAAGWYDPSVTIAGYVRHWYPDGEWGGDLCGCVDDRCIGFHHEAGEVCDCLAGWLDALRAVDEM